jgi:uncharacterized membrane protein
MNESIVFAAVALVCYGLSDFVFKRGSAAGIRPDHFLMVQAWWFFPAVLLYSWLTGAVTPSPAAAWGAVAGLFAFVGLYFFIRSLATGSVSTNSSVFRLNFIVTVVLVVTVLGEPLTVGKVIGVVAALCAAWLLLGGGPTGRQAKADAQRRSLAEVAVATFAFGASNFFHTIGLRHGASPQMLVVAQTVAFAPLATAVVYVADRNLRPPTKVYRYGAGSAVLLLGATLALLRGIAVGQASVVVPIAQMGFLVAAVLGVVLLGERLTLRKVAGFACALVALAALVVSAAGGR